jgi:two-component system, cell cycle response regulator
VSELSLRTRLYVVLGALFLVPLLVGALVLVFVVPNIGSDLLANRIPGSADAVRSEIGDECTLLGLAARSVALESGATTAAKAVGITVHGRYASYAAVLRPDGSIFAELGRLPDGAGPPAGLPPCTDAQGSGSVLAESVPVRGVAGAASAVAAQSVNGAFADKLARSAGADADVLLLRGAAVVASSLPARDARSLATSLRGKHGLVHVGNRVAQVDKPTPGAPYTVIVTARNSGLEGHNVRLALLILLAGAAAAGLLVTSVARGLSKPFADLTEVAERVAERVAEGDLGDLDAIVEHLPQGEAGRLGEAFNRVTTELRRNMSELEQSQEDLRESLERIGDTLMNTHDMDGLVQVVLETAVATLQARAGVVLSGAPDELRVVAERGLPAAGFVSPTGITPGAGVLGHVVASGEGVRGSIGSGPAELNPVSTEPGEGDILATPLRSMGAVIGVLALYGREGGRPFDATDEGALRTLARQAGTAIDNVQLHQEATRLSTTDGLTGLWNFRYLSMSLAREIERSTRFQRPLAVLMLDLDHFKQVNDRYGHARGDTVLRELAHRVMEQIREVDTFARYGGEEFVVVLPETTVEGAAQLADRICDAVRREPFRADGEDPLDITVSVGGAAFPDHGASAATLMRSADKALYVAKGEGRDRWHMPGA